MDIKLIAMDLDGTALREDRESFSPRLLAALEAANRCGVAIAPVTGRQYEFLPRVLKEHPRWENLVVLCNGAQIRRLADGEILFRVDIEETAQRALLRLAEEFDLAIEFSVDSRLYLTRHSLQLQLPRPELGFHRDVILKNYGCVVEDLAPLCGKTVEKVNLPYIPAILREQVVARLKQIRISAVWASGSSMEITHPDAVKGNGVQALCRSMGIPMESVMALGDSGNDETMLRQAGLGIAMGNAPDEIKACADWVSESNKNDGAAIAIEKFVLSA